MGMHEPWGGVWAVDMHETINATMLVLRAGMALKNNPTNIDLRDRHMVAMMMICARRAHTWTLVPTPVTC